jgi:RNA polymerase sigma-70 factor, ECF subfamily
MMAFMWNFLMDQFCVDALTTATQLEAQLEMTRCEIIQLLPRLRRFCMRLTGSSDAGDDLTQSAVERALSKIDHWQVGTKLDSWIFRIARNINIDEARARVRCTEQCDSVATENAIGEDGRDVIENRSTLACIRSAMAALSEDQRALVTLVIIEGKSYREAAEKLDIPIGTVMSRIARARQSIVLAVNGTA